MRGSTTQKFAGLKLTLAERAPGLVSEDVGEVSALADDRRERSAHDRLVDLVHDADQSAPHDLQADRVQLIGHAGQGSTRS